MSYEDLETARANRAAKEQAKAKGNGKRGRKRKGDLSEADATEAKVLRVKEGSDLARAPVAQMSEAQVVGDGISAPEKYMPGQKAPVARMTAA